MNENKIEFLPKYDVTCNHDQSLCHIKRQRKHHCRTSYLNVHIRIDERGNVCHHTDWQNKTFHDEIHGKVYIEDCTKTFLVDKSKCRRH